MLRKTLKRSIDFFELKGRQKYSLFIIRVIMGWAFLMSGLNKLFTDKGISLKFGYASVYLKKASPVQAASNLSLTGGIPEILNIPLTLLVKLGAYPAAFIADILQTVPHLGTIVIFSEILIGLGVLFGGFTRLSSFGGAFIMYLFYYGNAEWKHGLINGDLVYLVAFVIIGISGAGRIFGLDFYLKNQEKLENAGWAKYILS